MDYVFKTNEFEGPLDLLLHLIKQSNLNINDLKIDIITKQYLDAIKQMEEMNLTIASEYLVMAAELIEMKSRSLLPIEKANNDDDYIEDPKEILIKKLLEYEKYKSITGKFKELEEERNLIFTKTPESLKDYQIDELIIDDDLDLSDLLNAFNLFLEKQKLAKPLATKITTKEISIHERTTHIRNILKKHKETKFSELFDILEKPYIVVTFLAILEMAKKQELIIEQKKNFDEIMLSLRGQNNE